MCKIRLATYPRTATNNYFDNGMTNENFSSNVVVKQQKNMKLKLDGAENIIR